MKTVRKDRKPPQCADAAGLAALVDRIRAGDSKGAEELRGILGPGVRFLLRRRLESNDVDHERDVLLDDAIREIQSDLSLPAAGVPGMVRRLIQKRSGRNDAGLEFSTASGENGPEIGVAQEILGRMTTVERDALRRCYLLRQRPQAFLQGLNLSPEQFRAIQSRARAEFDSRKPPKTNVA